MNVEPCAYERVAAVEFRNLNADLLELRERVARVEAAMTRGMHLLVANLAGVVVMLAQQLLG
ncbi:MAG: hypothetical protein RLZZ303_2104 [Candidatus Hydrogenedentota bacterium]